jgi:outer membrane protein assembly factor BamB
MKGHTITADFFCASALLLFAARNQSYAQAPGYPLWSYESGVTIVASPAIGQNGWVYITIGSQLVALTNGGSNMWTFAMGDAGLGGYSSPAVAADGTFYVSGGGLYAVNADGSQKWMYPAGSGRGSAAIASDNRVYIHGMYLDALSPSGSFIWSNSIGGSYRYGSPALGERGDIYAPAPESRILHAIVPQGSEAWEVELPYAPGNSPAIGADGTVYVTGDGLYALSPAGSTLWVNTTNLFRDSSPAIGKDGTIYVASWGAGSLYAISPSGATKWRTDLAGNNYTNVPVAATPAIDDAGTIYYPAFNTLYALSPAGNVQWAFSPHDGAICQTSPAIGPDGTIYVTFGSKLYALYNTNKLADAPWPMYRQNARHTGKIERPALGQPQKRGDAGFEFQLYPHQLGLTYTIESSSNLYNWTRLTSFVATNVPTDVVDGTATNADVRFYRALSPP